MDGLRRVSWVLMWCGLIVAVVTHQDMLGRPDIDIQRIFIGAVVAVAIGLIGIYLTRRPGDGGFGF